MAKQALLKFNIDTHLNPYIPPSLLPHLPQPFRRFLGHRPTQTPEPDIPLQYLSTLLGTLAGLSVVSATYVYAPGLRQYNPPVIIASLGASAVLDYNTIRSPLAQPRNAIIGHALSAIVGVCVAKLFALNPALDSLSWVAGAIACAAASVLMSMTGTVHPPGGATAVLACTQAEIMRLGWMFIPFVLVGSLLMLGVALLVNNVVRQYPMYWWTSAEDVGGKLPWMRRETDAKEDLEAGSQDDAGSERTLYRTHSHSPQAKAASSAESISISSHGVQLPANFGALDEAERELLERLQAKLRLCGKEADAKA